MRLARQRVIPTALCYRCARFQQSVRHQHSSAVPGYGGLVSYLRHPSKDQELYLVGTVHISKQSSRMVKDVISFAKPDVVMVELCQTRRDKVLAMARGEGCGQLGAR